MLMIRTSQVVVLALACMGSARWCAAQAATGAASPADVQATAVNAHTFLLHISFAGATKQSSLFIHADKKDAPLPGAVKGTFGTGISTPAGELLMNLDRKQWELKDAQGKTLIAPSPLPSGMETAPGKAQVTARIASPSTSAVFYGSGDVNSGLVQTNGQGRVGNGTTGVPFYWTSDGYSALVLGENDNAPASWQRAADGTITWTAPGNTIDLYLTPAATLEQATQGEALLTGTPPVPPRWAFGYMQSRWGWRDRAYIEDALKQFTDRKLPVDAFIFDFEWYTAQNDYAVPAAGASGYSDFGFNPTLFPEPEKQIADLHAKGIHVVGIRKPRLGNLDSLNELRGRGWITAIDSNVAPARGRGGGRGTEQRLLDYSKPEVRDWYAKQMAPLLKAGIDGWWNDEGEQTYTMYTFWNQSEVLAQSLVDPKRRVWTINRAFAPGLQHLGAAAWAGDFLNNWQGLAQTPQRLLNWSLAGMYYGACDIGGFQGNISAELLTRWMQAGVFFPVMRSHSSNNVTPRFPWLYGEQAEGYIRKALEMRYRLVPYYYSLAHEANEKGTPLMRPLVMEFPDDPKVANMTNQWLMGKGLMAAPVLTASSGAGEETAGTKHTVYFPKGTWYQFDTNKMRDGGASVDMVVPWEEVPTYVRAGTILPLAPVIQHTNDLPGGPLDLQIYPGANATFTLTEDDGQTTAYAGGQSRKTMFTWDDASHTLSWTIDGPYRGKDIFQQMKVTLFDTAGIVTRDGTLQAAGKMVLNK